ncbi:hypothetical protein, partial [Pseudoalteromonas sp. P1-9]|uniref:hypothetical protein n=1 Tax=Pseudoalteromonas sp. P1-9 TaxID=1710354 RepID=UPI000A9322FE
IQVVSLLKKQNIQLAIKDLFEYQTVAQLADFIETNNKFISDVGLAEQLKEKISAEGKEVEEGFL